MSPESPIIVLSDRLIVLASVDETDIAQVYVNQEARIVLDSYPDEPLQARVSHVAYEATNKDNVITYEVDVLPEKVPDYMRSGMTAAVTFLGTSTNNVLVLPVETVRGDRFKRYVLSPGAPGKPPVETTIRTGLEDAKNVEILEGLAENDDVLVEDLEATMKQGARSTNPLNPFGRWSRRR